MSNAQIKLVRKLAQKKYRTETGLFVAEGLRLCEEVPTAQIEFGFYTREFISDERAARLVKRLKNLTEISASTMERLSDTQTPQGILLVVRQKLATLEEVLAKKIIAVLDGVQDPGNVGTILRTAAAFDCGMILLEGSADIFNPKVVRSSMGAIFYLPVTTANRADLLTLRGVDLVAAAVDSSAEVYWRHDFTRPVAIVFGSEALGVSKEILDVARKVFIPMDGHAESLNVATSAAIILSEAVRQTKL